MPAGSSFLVLAGYMRLARGEGLHWLAPPHGDGVYCTTQNKRRAGVTRNSFKAQENVAESSDSDIRGAW